MESLQRVRCLECGGRKNLKSHQPLQSLVLGLQHHPHPALTELVEDRVVPEDQRFPLALVNLLGLKLGELLLLHQLPSQLLAV